MSSLHPEPAPATPLAGPLMLAVVVLYRMSPAESKTVRGLARSFAEIPELYQQLRVLVWDNSPDSCSSHGAIPFPAEIRASGRNEGVAGAYNGALAVAAKSGIPWLLLLDQDTAVTPDFVNTMAAHARSLAGQGSVAAIAPFLSAGDRPLSPHYLRMGRIAPVPRSASGLASKELFAANSGCLMRVSALQEIGGYSSDFWLDYSDIYVFHQLHRRGKRVYLAGDASLQHEIAMVDYDRGMSPGRYANFLAAESAFHDLYKSPLERALYSARLLARAMRQRRLRDPQFSRLTWTALHARWTQSRRRRLGAWRRSNAARRDAQ